MSSQAESNAQGQDSQRPREDFPATSIGRTAGRSLFQPIQRTNSSDSSMSTSTHAHPLQLPPPPPTSRTHSPAPMGGPMATRAASAPTALNVPSLASGVRSRSPSPAPSLSPSYSPSRSHSPAPSASPSNSRSASPNPHPRYHPQSLQEGIPSAGGTTTPLGVPLSSTNTNSATTSGVSSSRPNMSNSAPHNFPQQPPLPSRSYTNPNPPSSASASPSPIPAPRYVPYTPRHRGGATVAPNNQPHHYQPPYQKIYQGQYPHPPPQHQQGYPPPPQLHPSTHAPAPSYPPHGDATSKLQFMALKAATQDIGLDTGSIGWAILEKLILEGGGGNGGEGYGSPGEWAMLWGMITMGKATLLLPLEQATTSDRITADFVRDHIALCDGPSRDDAPIVTLSGLRGRLDGDQLIFRSSLNTSSKTFDNLMSPSTRAPTFARLPPLPKIPLVPNPLPPTPKTSTTGSDAPKTPTPSSTETSSIASYTSTSSSLISPPSQSRLFTSPYPNFVVHAYTSNLPIPPRTSSSVHKPPPPPRYSPSTFVGSLISSPSSTPLSSSSPLPVSTSSTSSTLGPSPVSIHAPQSIARTSSNSSTSTTDSAMTTTTTGGGTNASARIMNPFASLFGHRSYTPSPSPSPSPAPVLPPPQSSAQRSVGGEHQHQHQHQHSQQSSQQSSHSSGQHHQHHHHPHSPHSHSHSHSPSPGGYPSVPSVSTVNASGHPSTYLASSVVDSPVTETRGGIVGGAALNINGAPPSSGPGTGTGTGLLGPGPGPGQSSGPTALVGGMIEISAYTIDKKVVRKEVGKAMNKALRAEVKERLTSTPLSVINTHSVARRGSGHGHGHSRGNSRETNGGKEGRGAGAGEKGADRDSNSGGVVNVPNWIVERVHEFTGDWYPVLKATPIVPVPKQSQAANANAKGGGGGFGRSFGWGALTGGGSSGGGGGSNQGAGGGGVGNGAGGGDLNLINAVEEQSLDDVSVRLQEFYSWLMEDALKIGRSPFGRNRAGHEQQSQGHGQDASEGSVDVGGEKKEGKGGDEMDEDEVKVRQILEVVERTICELFYDRLFMQPSSGDSAHDEALSSRVAALNMLDLGLDNLDVVIEDGMDAEVEVVVRACGEMLSQLEACHNPADKMAILVAAHKIVVDGLSRLPPIRLRTEEESQAAKAKRQQQKKGGVPVPDGKVQEKAPPIVVDATSPSEPSATSAVQEQAVEGSPETGTKDSQPQSGGVEENTARENGGSDNAGQESISASSTASTIKASESVISSQDTEAATAATTDVTAAAPTENLKPATLISPISRPSKPTPVSGDVLLPMIIFSVVKCNPSHLVSNLTFTQRFRCHSNVGGEETYCLINLLAVAEFLENVDLEGLGLGGSEKVLGAGPKPIPSAIRTTDTGVHLSSIHPPASPSSIRGRVEQQVDAIAGSANKVITGVVDSSFGILRSFLPGSDTSTNPSPTTATPPSFIAPSATITTPGEVPSSLAPWNAVKPGFGLLRRGDGFSIASLAASLPGVSARGGTGSRTGTGEESGQQLVAVISRPGSVRSTKSKSSFKLRVDGVDDGGSDMDGVGGEDGEYLDRYGNESDEDVGSGPHLDEGGSAVDAPSRAMSDVRSIKSIKSIESMMNERHRTAKKAPINVPRKSLSDRLANASGLSAAKSSPPSRPNSLLNQPIKIDTPISSRSGSPAPGSIQLSSKLPPPNQYFLESSAEDLKLSDVGVLLSEYKKLVGAVRAAGGFEE